MAYSVPLRVQFHQCRHHDEVRAPFVPRPPEREKHPIASASGRRRDELMNYAASIGTTSPKGALRASVDAQITG